MVSTVGDENVTLAKNRNFLLLLVGKTFSNIGGTLYYIGILWLVYDLSGSTLYTGIAAFLIRSPQAAQFLVGPLVDQWDLKRVIISTQIIISGLLIVIPAANLANHLTVEIILLLIFFISITDRFTLPAQKAIIPVIISEENVLRANSIFESTYRSVEAITKAAGGILIVLLGTTVYFTLNSVGLALAAIFVAGLNYRHSQQSSDPVSVSGIVDNYMQDLQKGFSYVKNTVILWFAVRGTILNFGNGVLLAVLPAFAAARYGPELYGALLAAIAIGLIVGSVLAAQFEDYPLGKLIVVSDALSGILLLLALTVPSLSLLVLLFGVVWIPVGIIKVNYNSVIQTGVDPNCLGRVTSATSSLSLLLMPVGALVGGVGGELVGSELIVMLLGPLFLFSATLWLALEQLRTLPQPTEIDFSLPQTVQQDCSGDSDI